MKPRSTTSMLRSVFLAAAAVILSSCGGLTARDQKSFAIEPGDYAMIAHEALRQLERTRSIDVIAVPAGFNSDARAGLKSQRKIVTRESLPSHSIPRDMLAMRSFAIDEDGIAIFEGEISTDAQDAMPAGSVSCGLIFAVRFQLVGNDWHSDSYKLTDCTQERVWWPSDQPQPNSSM
jgi:hypothetical protein